MNFCGAQYDHQILDSQARKVSGVLCGPCVKDGVDPADDVYLIDDEDDEDDDILEGKRKAPLDIIEDTISNKKTDEEDEDEDTALEDGSKKNRLVSVVGPSSVARSGATSAFSSTSSTTTSMSTKGRMLAFSSTTPVAAARTNKSLETSTPSPIYLNPISADDWNDQTRQSKPELLCPSIEPMSSAFTRLLRRLERGFRVQFYPPGPHSAKENVLLFLDRRHNRICIQADEDEKKEDEAFWYELPMEKILRLEIGGKSRTGSHQLNAFAIVVKQDFTNVYYDFVASSPIERELIVSTLMVVLDRLQNSIPHGMEAFPSVLKDDDTSLEKKFSMIVKSIEDQNSLTGTLETEDDRERALAEQKFASIINGIDGKCHRTAAHEDEEEEREVVLAEKKFSSIIQGGKSRSPSMAERKSFSSFSKVGDGLTTNASLTGKKIFSSLASVSEDWSTLPASSLPTERKSDRFGLLTEKLSDRSAQLVKVAEDRSNKLAEKRIERSAQLVKVADDRSNKLAEKKSDRSNLLAEKRSERSALLAERSALLLEQASERSALLLSEKMSFSARVKGVEDRFQNSSQVVVEEEKKEEEEEEMKKSLSFSLDVTCVDDESSSKKAVDDLNQSTQLETTSITVVEAIDVVEHAILTEKNNIPLFQGIGASSLDDDINGQTYSASAEKSYFAKVDDVGDQKSITLIEDDDFGFGGTMDEPIPCSPSLEQHLFQPDVSEFSPKRRTHLFNDSRAEGTEASLVIHLEHMLGHDSYSMPVEEEGEEEEDDDNYDPKLGIQSSRFSASEDASKICSNIRAGSASSKSGSSMSSSQININATSHSSKARPVSDTKLKDTHPESDSSIKSPEVAPTSRPSYRAASPRPTPETMHLQGAFGSKATAPVAEGMVPANAKTEDLMIEFASSSGHLASAWCADNDMCTLALKDIADTCSSAFSMKQAESGCTLPSDFSEQQALIEEYVANALGAPSAFYSYLTDGKKWSAEETYHEDEPKPSPLNGRVRNRAGVLNAQARKLRRLRSEMTFAAALKRSKDNNMQYIQTTKSFDEARLFASKKATEAVKQFHSSALIQHVVGTMLTNPGRPQAAEEEEVAYYDSDPEDTRPQTTKKNCPRRAKAEMSSLESSDDDFVVVERQTPSGFEKVKTTKRVSKKLDEETIIQIVQTMTNERMTLIWHPTQHEKLVNRSPLCVRVWIEAGVCLLDGTFVLPKLSWSRVIDKGAEDIGGRRQLAQDEPYKVDLLDICRVHATQNIDRQRHPFADARKSFFIETQSDAILFEALTSEERDRIVYGLKLAIARLASLLMLRDVRAAEEFFGAVSPPVPGEAPVWAQGTTTKPEPPLGGLPPTMNK